jgi:hypothetical protein
MFYGIGVFLFQQIPKASVSNSLQSTIARFVYLLYGVDKLCRIVAGNGIFRYMKNFCYIFKTALEKGKAGCYIKA